MADDDAMALHILAGVVPSVRGNRAKVGASCLLFKEGTRIRFEQLVVQRVRRTSFGPSLELV